MDYIDSAAKSEYYTDTERIYDECHPTNPQDTTTPASTTATYEQLVNKPVIW